jgi:hypothetical protein
MRLVSDRVRRALKWAAIIVGPMLAMGWAVGSWYPNDWRPIEASVQSSRIESVRYGNLQWALMVEAAYEVSGRPYATRRDVFHDVDYDVVEAEARNWPPGRSFRLYVDAKNPESASLVPDGGREATIVTAVLLTPMLVGLAVFVLMILRRPRASDNTVVGRTD